MAFNMVHSSVAPPGAASFPRALWLETKPFLGLFDIRIAWCLKGGWVGRRRELLRRMTTRCDDVGANQSEVSTTYTLERRGGLGTGCSGLGLVNT